MNPQGDYFDATELTFDTIKSYQDRIKVLEARVEQLELIKGDRHDFLFDEVTLE